MFELLKNLVGDADSPKMWFSEPFDHGDRENLKLGMVSIDVQSYRVSLKTAFGWYSMAVCDNYTKDERTRGLMIGNIPGIYTESDPLIVMPIAFNKYDSLSYGEFTHQEYHIELVCLICPKYDELKDITFLTLASFAFKSISAKAIENIQKTVMRDAVMHFMQNGGDVGKLQRMDRLTEGEQQDLAIDMRAGLLTSLASPWRISVNKRDANGGYGIAVARQVSAAEYPEIAVNETIDLGRKFIEGYNDFYKLTDTQLIRFQDDDINQYDVPAAIAGSPSAPPRALPANAKVKDDLPF